MKVEEPNKKPFAGSGNGSLGVGNAYMRSLRDRLLTAQTLAQRAEGMGFVIQSPLAVGSQRKNPPAISAPLR